MGSKAIFIKPSRGNRILLLQFSDSLGPKVVAGQRIFLLAQLQTDRISFLMGRNTHFFQIPQNKHWLILSEMSIPFCNTILASHLSALLMVLTVFGDQLFL